MSRFHEWMRDSVGLSCEEQEDFPNFCEIRVRTALDGKAMGVIGLTSEDGAVGLESDIFVRGELPCDWVNEATEYAWTRCMEVKGKGLRECMKEAEKEYFRGPFQECSDRNLLWLRDLRPELFIGECPLREAHGHLDVAHLHYRCRLPKEGRAVRDAVFRIIEATQGPEVAGKLRKLADIRRRG